jgi:hypothetical protein
MAKTPKTSEQEGEISVSMIKFTMKGSDASLQKGLDSIKAAFVQAGFAVVPEVRQLRSNSSRQPQSDGDELEAEVPEDMQEVGEVDDVVAAPPSPSRRSSSPKRPPNFKIMKELKFDDVSPSLTEFVGEKKPESHLDRYLCIAYWFKHIKGVEDLTTEHFFTAYMNYKWPLPASAATPVADLRHQKRQLFVAGSSPATSTISNTGERRVMELGKAEA